MKIILPSTEKMVLKTLLVMIVLGMSNWSCTGFPVYDYDLASLRQALGASVAEVNARALSPYLFRAFRSSIKRPAASCRSTVQMSAEQVQDVWVLCHWSSSSESDSSEEMVFGGILGSSKWRNSYLVDLIPDKPRREQFYERSHETMSRVFPSGYRRYPNQRHRARVNIGFE
uniref:Secreted phosphoprotein 2 n=1 Tax=Myotis myotis TaxID=51298 RepID=A0A7J7WJC5_MYOMY|nr:secreted phosphoprotein 2 [Myotis myotis]